MTDHSEHTLSPACWCNPVVMHVSPRTPHGPSMVDTAQDAEKLAELGFLNVFVRPDVPTQGKGVTMLSTDYGQGSSTPRSGGENEGP